MERSAIDLSNMQAVLDRLKVKGCLHIDIRIDRACFCTDA